MDNRKDLTGAERRYLERVAEAQERGLTLEDYYRACGLSVGWLHKIRSQLQCKGVAVPQPTTRAAAARSGNFLQVWVKPRTGSEGSAVCRLRHPSGWVIECVSWPPGSWLVECFGGARHAAA